MSRPSCGYIGVGMLSAAVVGEVFTSRSSSDYFISVFVAAIKAVAGEPGALLVVKTPTGDRLNFRCSLPNGSCEGIPAKWSIAG